MVKHLIMRVWSVFLLFIFAGAAGVIATPPVKESAPGNGLEPVVVQAQGFAETPELIKSPSGGQPVVAPDIEGTGRTIPVHYFRRSPKAKGKLSERDPVIQTSAPELTTPSPNLTFDGVNNNCSCTPPDPNGAVGPSNYVSIVNTHYQVFNKFTGAAQTAIIPINNLFAGLSGTTCATTDDGDPIVLYDQLADRWLVAQFANASSKTGPWSMSVAISKTPDPTGGWYAYCFQTPTGKFPDYPKFGVWPDGYYMTDNQFNGAGTSFLGTGVFAFNRAKMLVGDPTANYIYFNLNSLDSSIFGMLPSSVDGPPPPVGTPNYFAYYTSTVNGDAQDGLRLFQFHADFVNTNLSTFTERTESPITVASFNPNVASIPQSGTSQTLDTLADRLMFRLQYRNFSTNESLVVTHSVVGGSAQAAVRYYQLKRSLPGSGTFTVNEQATFAPTTQHRWMGSAAMNYRGDLAVGYSCSSSTNFPSIRYAARLASDPPNGLFQGEAILNAGAGSQTGSSRWGDYSCLTVDPTDDCTFWYTTEYYSSSSSTSWRTRVGNFTLPGCSAAPKGTIQGIVSNGGLPVSNAVVRTTSGYVRVTDGSGSYSMGVSPGTYDMSAIVTGVGTGSVSGVAVVDGGTTTQNFSLGGPSCILNVSKTGTGTGTITSSPSGIDCGATCTSVFSSNAVVQLSAAAGPNAVFTGWGGAASGSSSPVTITLNSNQVVTANFAGLPSIVAAGVTLTSESCVATNGAIDPGETVTANFTLQNVGTGNATNVTAILLATGGVTSPSGVQNFGTLAGGGGSASQPFTFTATGSCGGTLTAVLQVSQGPTVLGNVTNIFNLGSTAVATISKTNSTTLIIPGSGTGATTGAPASSYPSTVTVAGANSAVTKVTVTLFNIAHTYPDDIDVLLVGPTGQSIILMSDVGGSVGITNVTITLDDAASSSLPDSTVITAGAYKPTNISSGDAFPSPASTNQLVTTLGAFNGLNPNGTWSLYVVDDASVDVGQMTGGWALNITTSTNVCCSGAVNSPPVISAASISPASPMTTNILVASVTSSNDVDGDPITLAYQWQESTNNTIFGNIAFTASTLPAAATVAGDYYRVIITPNDTHVNGTPFTTASVFITVDSNGNGLNDDWEIANFGQLGVNPNADPDGDGFTNLQEFQAGTNPNDAHSVPAIATATPSGNDFVITFPTIAGKNYEVQRSDELPSWSPFTNFTASGPSSLAIDLGGALQSNRYYRVRILP